MRGMSKSAFDPTETCVLERMLLCLAKWSEQVWSRIGRGRHLAALAFGQAIDNHAAASRPVAVAPRRSRHRTRPCSIRASGTAKVGTMTSG